MAVPLLIAAVGLQVIGGIQEGNELERQAENEERINQFNQSVAEQQANEEEAAAAERAIIQEREGEKFKSRQRAVAGTTGIETRGSILSVLEDTAVILELDRLNIIREGGVRAGQKRATATNFGFQASAAKGRAKAQSRATVLTAVGTGLSGFGKIADR